MNTAPTPAEMPSPEELQTLGNIISGSVLMRALLTLANFDVAGALGNTPETPAALAKKVGADAGVLARFLRLVSSVGIFKNYDGAYGHTPLSRMLRADHPMSARGQVQLMRTAWKVLDALDHSMATGRAGAESMMPGGFWKYLEDNPTEGRIFDEGMTSKSLASISPLVAAYDFARFSTIADVGGGRGHLIGGILQACPNTRGIVFDLPQVIDKIAGEVPRLTRRGGDFFKDDMPASDAYIMMNVLHDWDDAECIAILKNLRRSMRPGSKLLVIELLVGNPPVFGGALMNDLIMLAYAGGKERTESEYDALLSASGWRRERTMAALPTDLWIMEVSPA